MTGEQLAWKIRRHGVEMTHLSGGSHLASILSVADIMGKLYAEVLRVDPKNPKDENRDRFILSKGHAGASVYAALAESGSTENILAIITTASRILIIFFMLFFMKDLRFLKYLTL